jgi:hypothetical protein
MRTLIAPAVTLALLAIAWPGAEASAGQYGCKSAAKYCFVSDACKQSNPACGSIVYANKGGYSVGTTRVEAQSGQPTDKAQIHPDCSGTSWVSNADLAIGQYDQFIVPADCAYKLKINIVAGRTKHRDLFLTPGCVIETSTDGTTMQNEWHMKVYWAPKLNKSGTPTDAAGNKCGKEGKM